jgi:translation initiation factor 1 (eIF-1/SUI1)
MNLCKCGCGGKVNEGKRFIQGHHTKTVEARKGMSDIGGSQQKETIP